MVYRCFGALFLAGKGVLGCLAFGGTGIRVGLWTGKGGWDRNVGLGMN